MSDHQNRPLQNQPPAFTETMPALAELELLSPELIGDGEYPTEPMVRGWEVGWGPDAAERALTYAQSLFTDAQLTVASLGSSAVLLDDGEGRLLKVFRTATNYRYVENEAGALALLHRQGLAPKPLLLVDADDACRAAPETVGSCDFRDEALPRYNARGPLPIIVLERLDLRPLKELPSSQLQGAFDSVWHVAREQQLALLDTELAYDATRNAAVFVDLGGVLRYDRGSRYRTYIEEESVMGDTFPGLSDEQMYDILIASDVLGHFLQGKAHPPRGEIAHAIATEGIAGLHQLLERHWQA